MKTKTKTLIVEENTINKQSERVIPETKECTVCHKEKILNEFNNQRNGKYGKSSVCKICTKENTKNYRKTEKGKKKYLEYHRRHRSKPEYLAKHQSYRENPKGVWYSYRTGANRRKLEFDLTIKDIEDLFWQKPCFYCGDDIKTAGIDRVDNEKGYIVSNLVPCCSICNFMKLQMSITDFISHCKRIALIHER
jgi:tRNA nucleotidyltransferase/poly(A) polymerase